MGVCAPCADDADDDGPRVGVPCGAGDDAVPCVPVAGWGTMPPVVLPVCGVGSDDARVETTPGDDM